MSVSRLTWAGVAALVIGLSSCSAPSSSADKDGRQDGGSVWDRSPDLVLTADQLGKEFNEDRKVTREKYKGKLIELTGVVRSFAWNNARQALIYFDVKGDIVNFPCLSTEKEPWLKVTPGQKVRLKAMFLPETALGDISVGPILEVTGEPAPILTAEGLAKEYEMNREAAHKKYAKISGERNAVVFTGVVTEVVPDMGGGEVYLQTGSRLRMSGFFVKWDEQKLRPGMKVKVVAAAVALGEGQTTIRVDGPILMNVFE
jgi:hypothetical protein